MKSVARIVVVDGSEIARIGISRALADHGHTIAAATGDADGALRLATTVEADVFLVDITLDGYDGLIKSLVALGVRVIATGVEADIQQPFVAICAGAVGYLTKDLPSRAWAQGIAAA